MSDQHFKAKQRVENIDSNPDGSPGPRGFLVEEGQIVEADHPALALHPDAFVELGEDNEPLEEPESNA